MGRPRTNLTEPQAQPTDREAQWQAYAGELARKLAAAEATIQELEKPLPKRVWCFSLPGGPVQWRLKAVSEERARAQLPAEAAGAAFRGCA
jgi:hypothetical protein